MAEEFKTQGEPLKNEQSTKVTYHGDDGSPEYDVIYGVPMQKGQSVDLAEFMEPEQAQRFAKKLQSNPQFEVQGTPRAKPRQGAAALDRNMIDQAARTSADARNRAQLAGQEPPEGYDAPLQAVLESNKTAPERGEQAKEAEKGRPNLPRGK